MKSVIPVLAVFSVITSLVLAEALAADQVLSQAKAKAVAEHKAIFGHFGASWRCWCRRLDAFLERADIKPGFGRYFLPVKKA